MQVWAMLSRPGFSTFIKVWGVLIFRLYLIMFASILSVQILYNFIKSLMKCEICCDFMEMIGGPSQCTKVLIECKHILGNPHFYIQKLISIDTTLSTFYSSGKQTLTSQSVYSRFHKLSSAKPNAPAVTKSSFAKVNLPHSLLQKVFDVQI